MTDVQPPTHYGPWKIKADPTACITTVFPPGLEGIGSQHQCRRKRGHGKDGLYCRQHADLLERPLAKIITCPGIDPNNPAEHFMRDNCWTCAPWWEKIRVCPKHDSKLPMSGWCAKCRRYYDTKEQP